MKKIIVILIILITEFGFSQSGKYVMWEFYNPYNVEDSTAQFSSLDLKKDNKFVLNIFYWKVDKENDCKKIIGTWKIEKDTLSLIENKTIRYYIIKDNSIVAPKQKKEGIDYYFDKVINLDFLLKLDDGSIQEHTKEAWLKQSKKSCH